MNSLMEMAAEYRRFAEKLEAVEIAHAAAVKALQSEITRGYAAIDKELTKSHVLGQLTGLRSAQALVDSCEGWRIPEEIKRLIQLLKELE